VEAGPEDIVTTTEITGNPATWLAQSIAEFQERPHIGSNRWRDLWSAGLSVAQTDAILPAGEIIREVVAEYGQTCHDLTATIRR